MKQRTILTRRLTAVFQNGHATPRVPANVKTSMIAVGLMALLPCSGLAQSSLLGKYSGTYTARVGIHDRAMGLTLVIATVDGDAVYGTAVRISSVAMPPCNGEYPVEGKLKGDMLELRASKKGGPRGDCSMVLRLKVDRNRLVGTMNGVPAQLRK